MGPTCVLELLPEIYSVYRYPPETPLPLERPEGEGLWAYVGTSEEVSVVSSQREARKISPEMRQVESGWRALKVRGPLDFSLVGILASIAAPLAEAGISIFSISTFDTDYILVKEITLEKAQAVLEEAGHQVLTGFH
jgi:uncharacterized protein